MSRNKYPEQTVEKILDAAACLFAQKGYTHTTCRMSLTKQDFPREPCTTTLNPKRKLPPRWATAWGRSLRPRWPISATTTP